MKSIVGRFFGIDASVLEAGTLVELETGDVGRQDLLATKDARVLIGPGVRD